MVLNATTNNYENNRGLRLQFMSFGGGEPSRYAWSLACYRDATEVTVHVRLYWCCVAQQRAVHARAATKTPIIELNGLTPSPHQSMQSDSRVV